VIRAIQADIEEAFDGITNDGHCDGSYRMEDGTFARDKLLKLWILVDPRRLAELRRMASRIAGVLGQESLYFEVTASEVELVPPLQRDGETE